MSRCIVVSLGRVEYRRAWDLQNELRRRVIEGSLPDTLLLVEHPHVYSVGRRGKESDILIPPEQLRELGAEVHFVDRGGLVTYHGPGQLVAYPIFDVKAWGGPMSFVSMLADVMTATLAEYGIAAYCEGRPTGVWAGDAKIAAIGLKISRGVNTHGLALNVNPDLSYFDHIVPCGMPDADVTSMAREGVSADVGQVLPVLADQFGKVFKCALDWSTLEEVEQAARSAEPARA